MTVKNPLFQPVLIFAQWEIPVFGRFFDQSVSRVILVGRIYQFFRRQRSSAVFTLIAICALKTAARAGADNVAVGQKFTCDLVAKLLLGEFLQFTLVIECPEKVTCEFMVNGTCCAAIDIKRYTEVLKRFLDECMVAVYHLLDRDAFFPCTDGDRHTVFVASANKHNVLFL